MKPCQEGHDFVKHGKDDTQCKSRKKDVVKRLQACNIVKSGIERGSHTEYQQSHTHTPQPDSGIGNGAFAL